MIELKITKTNGDVVRAKVTPAVQYAFETHFNLGFVKAFTEEQKSSYLYWLAWKCLSLVEDVSTFGEKFLTTLENVEIEDSSPNE